MSPAEASAPKIPYQASILLISDNSIISTLNLTDRDLIREKYPELDRIINCESSWLSGNCSYAGCQAGMGLGQLIPSTLKYCEEKLNKKLDPFNAQNNLECVLWLYEKEGSKHWNSSQRCWKP